MNEQIIDELETAVDTLVGLMENDTVFCENCELPLREQLVRLNLYTTAMAEITRRAVVILDELEGV